MYSLEDELKQNLYKTKYDLVLEVIEKAVPLLDGKVPPSLARIAKEEYLDILENLDSIPDLNEEQRTKLRTIIQEKIKDLPSKEEVEEQRRSGEEMVEKTKEEKEKAWKEAKKRYASQSIFKKIIHMINKTRPNDYEKPHIIGGIRLDYVLPEDVKRMYGGDHDR